MPRRDLIQLRHGTAAEWSSADPVLASGEVALEIDGTTGTTRVKVGDGTTVASALPYTTPAMALSAIADLVDNSSGTASTAIAPLAPVTAPVLLSDAASLDDINTRFTTVSDNFATLATQVNAILGHLRTSGVMTA